MWIILFGDVNKIYIYVYRNNYVYKQINIIY